MSISHHRSVAMFIALAACAGSAAAASPSPAAEFRSEASTLSPKARGQLTRQFVLKWGDYVQRVYEVPVAVWAQRMVSTFGAADPSNFRNALKRDTFEGAVAELTGTGHRLKDDAVIERYARASLSASRAEKGAAAIGAKALGSTTGDLVFTAVTPCRIVDTRVAGGAINANGERGFLGVSSSAGVGFESQGGSSTDCGVAAIGASAIAINVTAVTPATAGFATVFRSGDTRPLAASVNYVAGDIVNNSVIVGIPNPLTSNDFRIYTFAQSHYVVDIVGYFSPPRITQLQCSNTAVSTFNIPAGTSTFFDNPACPAGYDVAVTPYCFTNATGVYSRGSGYNGNASGQSTFCAWQNTTGSAQQVLGGAVCCRIPGR
jgi:hypothetical protein